MRFLWAVSRYVHVVGLHVDLMTIFFRLVITCVCLCLVLMLFYVDGLLVLTSFPSSHFSCLGPTKWLHLTPSAHESVDQIHFTIWKDVWKNPHSSVDVADRVSKEVMRLVTSDVI